jgi:hypothetical protein
MERIFAGSLLPPPPARVPEGVYIGCPEVQTRATSIAERARFGTDCSRHGIDERVVKRRAEENGLRKRSSMAEIPARCKADPMSSR